jgi:thiopeptide-type bacteriocin biosynthesis protein
VSRWISIHVFYSLEQRTLLLECFAPVLAKLSRQSLLQRFFFIRYWEGGPHIRLRVAPVAGAEEYVREELESTIRAFLLEKPVFFVMPEGSQVWAKRNFVLEYGEEELYRKYGPEGIIPSYAENTLHHIAYEPETERYGGPEGILASERHFHVSSQMILDRLAWDNMHITGVKHAQAITIMLGLCFAFLETEQSVANFLKAYATTWHIRFFAGKPDGLTEDIMQRAELAVPKIEERIVKMAHDYRSGSRTAITEEDAAWAMHARTFKAEIMTLITDGHISIANTLLYDKWGDSPAAKLTSLLFSFIHMTNNRLGLALTEEISMSYLIYRSLSTQ